MSDLEEINGIGNSIADQLDEIGITTVNALANADPSELDDAGIRRAEVLVDRARKRGVMVESGESVERDQAETTEVSTGMQELDHILGGGLQGGHLIGISGEPKAGKTQFAFQMLASAADFTDGHAVYIETEPNRFHIDRIKSLCRQEDSYKRIHRIQAHDADPDVDNLELQKNSYDAVRESFDDVSIVVVDSFIANFRLSGKFESRADLPERNSIIADHLQRLQGLTNHFDCPTLMTLQVMGNPDQFSSGQISVWGPVLMDHTITHLIHISHAKGELREAELKGHPGLPDRQVTLKIPEDAPIEAVN